MPRRDESWWYPPSQPKPAPGGIRPRSGGRNFGGSWWARRWIEVLEGFQIGARLGRGKKYARMGQVLAIEIEPGVVTARVQGSRSRPYRVSIRLEPITGAGRHAVARALGAHTGIAASLLAGEMPEDLEHVFRRAGLSLFPQRYRDLNTACSCPDSANPCKHIAAVYLLLAEEFDRNPFVLLRLRGLDRETVAGVVAAAPDAEGPADAISRPAHPEAANPGPAHSMAASPGPAHSMDAKPLPLDPEFFWGRDVFRPSAAGPDVAAPSPALLSSLGRPSFWRGTALPEETLEAMTARASALAADLLAGEGVQRPLAGGNVPEDEVLRSSSDTGPHPDSAGPEDPGETIR